MQDKNLPSRTCHAEYKIPHGKLVVVDLQVSQGRLSNVRLSGDFFLEPPETLAAINVALEGLPKSVSLERLQEVIGAAITSEVAMYGLTIEGIATVVRRALA